MPLHPVPGRFYLYELRTLRHAPVPCGNVWPAMLGDSHSIVKEITPPAPPGKNSHSSFNDACALTHKGIWHRVLHVAPRDSGAVNSDRGSNCVLRPPVPLQVDDIAGVPPRTRINTGPYERLAEGEHSLPQKLGWACQPITNEQALHADDPTVHLDMNWGQLSNMDRGKREAGIITLQVIARVSTRRWPICLKDFRFLPADQHEYCSFPFVRTLSRHTYAPCVEIPRSSADAIPMRPRQPWENRKASVSAATGAIAGRCCPATAFRCRKGEVNLP